MLTFAQMAFGYPSITEQALTLDVHIPNSILGVAESAFVEAYA